MWRNLSPFRFALSKADVRHEEAHLDNDKPLWCVSRGSVGSVFTVFGVRQALFALLSDRTKQKKV